MHNRACFMSAPPDLRAWSPGAVSVSLSPGIDRSDFPASIGGMLVLRVEGRSFDADGAILPEVALIGPSRTPGTYRNEGQVVACGLLLSPSAVMAITGMSNRWAASGMPVSLDTVRPVRVRELAACLRRDATAQARGDLLFEWLRAVVMARPAISARAIDDNRLADVIGRGLDTACRELGIGVRQLERRCLDAFGMSPHRAHAVLRMQSTLRQALRAPIRARGADLALSHAYYDQSHMARDLRRLAGAPLGRIVDASRVPDGSLWAFNVGRQQFSS